MDITPYVDSLRRDLVAAAESGSDEIRAAAERLSMALDPAARLAFMEALSHAAAEITAELPAGTVDVRLNGRELDFVVTAPVSAPAPPNPPRPPGPEDVVDDGNLARITLRIPESVKTRAEEFADPQWPVAQHLAGQPRPRRHLRRGGQHRHRPVQHPVWGRSSAKARAPEAGG